MTRTLLAGCVAATFALGPAFFGGVALAQDGVTPVRVGGNIQVPKKIKDVRPVYPLQALQARVSGIVIVETTIHTDGTVRSARVIRSIPLLDQAAIDAVSQWVFTPPLVNGSPMPVIMSVTVNFALDGNASSPGVSGAPGNPAAPEDLTLPQEQRSGPEILTTNCVTDPGTPEHASRLEAVIKFLEDVNAKQRTVFIARQGKGYAPRLDQLPGLPPLEGFDVQLATADRAYTISVKEKTKACSGAFFSDQTGSIYIARRSR